MPVDTPGMDVDPAIDHAIDVMLRERIGGESAPDLVRQVLASSERERQLAVLRATQPARRFRSWLAAALLFLCVAIVVTVAALQGDDPRDPAAMRFEPETLAQLQESISRALHADLQVEFTRDRRRIPIPGSGGRHPTNPISLELLGECLHGAEPVAGTSRPSTWSSRLHLRLAGGHYTEALLGFRDDRVFVFGLGQIAIPRRPMRRLNEVTREIEQRQRRRAGIVFGREDLRSLANEPDATMRRRIVGVELRDRDLTVLGQSFPNLEELDLTASEGLNLETLTRLASLEQLRWLRLHPNSLNGEQRARLEQTLSGCRIEIAKQP